jgi:hypothetical protein
VLGEEDDAVPAGTQFSHVLVVVFDVLGLGTGDEKLLLYLQRLLLHHQDISQKL